MKKNLDSASIELKFAPNGTDFGQNQFLSSRSKWQKVAKIVFFAVAETQAYLLN